MRADRLLSIMLLLQTRGRLTARQLADALEVSERTVYRDVDALSAAGVPIYAERGPGGGVALLDDYRTSLTGLTDDERRALLALSIPSPLHDLGLGEALQGALLKLDAALPEAHRSASHMLRQRLHIDAAMWSPSIEPAPHLPALYDAVRHDQVLTVTRRLVFETLLTQEIAPYGLVAKAGVWYVVFARGDALGVFEASQVIAVQATGETFNRPPAFDLADFWAEWCAKYEHNRPVYAVRARVAPALHSTLRWLYSWRYPSLLAEAEAPDEHGWQIMTLPFESLEDARKHVLGFGRALEVIAPVALRRSVRDFAEQIVAFYGALDSDQDKPSCESP